VKAATIFVELVGEGTPCWRPVEAEQLAAGSFRIIGVAPKDERWRFNSGDIVRCKPHQFQNGLGLIAYMREK
jgi:hypothetical protein